MEILLTINLVGVVRKWNDNEPTSVKTYFKH